MGIWALRLAASTHTIMKVDAGCIGLCTFSDVSSRAVTTAGQSAS